MADISSLKQKAEIVQGIVNKLYPFKTLIFLIGPDQILEFSTKRDIKEIVKQRGAAIMFFETQSEADGSRSGMISNLEAYKKILAGASDDYATSIEITNYCLDLLNSAVFMKILL